jgi:7,8-dihydro-6-hydroxymethylpterin dimethyltransferase
MARLEQRDYTYFATVRGMCRECREVVPARVFFRDGKVWQQNLCPLHGADGPPPKQNAARDVPAEPALIAGDQNWYLQNVLAAFPDHSPLRSARAPVHGCPHDCGPCAWHASPCQLPVLSITNACNLDCPICFTYNRPDRTYFMSVEEMNRTVDWVLKSSGPVDLINVTGGEPTLHPQILDILKCCQRPGIGRVTMNSNGLVLAENPDLCKRLAEMNVYVILSFNTFDSAVSKRMHGRDVVGAKMRAIENLTRAGVRMTLLHVMMRGVNESAIGGILDLMRGNDNILSLTVQTMTYTGQGGGKQERQRHIPVDEAARIVCEHSSGQLDFADFVPRPSAHPLCYLMCYALKQGNELLPFTRFTTREKIASVLQDSYLIRVGEDGAWFREIIADLFARGETAPLKTFRRLVQDLYPANRALDAWERQRIAESAVRTIYIHAHMDEDTFDCSRAMLCPDLVPSEPGRLIPACTYNLFYRMKDERFYVRP